MKSKFLLVTILFFYYHINTSSQYFGQNKPGYEVFKYNVKKTRHFEIYSNFNNDSVLKQLAILSEYWYLAHSRVFGDTLKIINPLLFYENHADFQQTNVSSDIIGVGTGGFTEGFKNRVVMPVSISKAQTDHVLGHELVHAFQYNMLLSDSFTLQEVGNIPLWMIEGMAEYLSLGSIDPHTSIWMRDAVANNRFPTIEDMTKKMYEYNPYRYGQAFWTFTARMWGDTVAPKLLKATARFGYDIGMRMVLGVDAKTFSGLWKSASELHFKKLLKDSVKITGKAIITDKNAGHMNVSPVISPDGKYVAFISEKELFTTDLYLADAENGKILKKLTSTIRNDEIDAFNYIESAGSWSPDNKKFAYVVFSKGRNKLIIIDVKRSKIIEELSIPGIKAFANPSWSPDGKKIVFSGTLNGKSDLFIYNLETKEVKNITNDNYSYLHPSWSPDGEWIVFSTDENYEKGTRRPYVPYSFDIGMINVKTGEKQILNIFPGAGNLNPIFTSDGKALIFLSDRDGYRNLYKYSLEDGITYQLTDYNTGICGITLLSPAISISQNNHICYSYYNDKKYLIYSAHLDSFPKIPVNPFELNYDAATLPPLERVGYNIVDYFRIKRPQILATIEKQLEIDTLPYKPKFKLDYITNTSVGIATSRLGTGMAGSVLAIFSDMVGDHQIFANLGLNGEIYDFGGQLAYINQKRRIDWGISLSHVPYRYGYYSLLLDTLNINDNKVLAFNYALDIIRIFESQIAFFAYFPISITRRIESGFSYSRYSYRIDRFNNYYSDPYGYYYIGQSRTKLDAPPGFNLFQTDAAYVYDNSYFGITSPLKGARSRIQGAFTFGEYTFFTTLFDYRKYLQLMPFTFAFRVLNYNKLGKDAENENLIPLYIGYPWYIRGYDQTSSTNPYGNKVTINHLIGSKMVVSNFEIRLPFTGPERLCLIRSKILFTELSLFTDAGLIWSKGEKPDLFKWQLSTQESLENPEVQTNIERIPLVSAGISLRINLFGYLVLEPYYAAPFQNGGFKNMVFGLNFVPGW